MGDIELILQSYVVFFLTDELFFEISNCVHPLPNTQPQPFPLFPESIILVLLLHQRSGYVSLLAGEVAAALGVLAHVPDSHTAKGSPPLILVFLICLRLLLILQSQLLYHLHKTLFSICLLQQSFLQSFIAFLQLLECLECLFPFYMILELAIHSSQRIPQLLPLPCEFQDIAILEGTYIGDQGHQIEVIPQNDRIDKFFTQSLALELHQIGVYGMQDRKEASVRGVKKGRLWLGDEGQVGISLKVGPECGEERRGILLQISDEFLRGVTEGMSQPPSKPILRSLNFQRTNHLINYISLLILSILSISGDKLHMSKPKPKEKKGESAQATDTLAEEQKREILEQSFTIKRLQDRISLMMEENYEITSTKDKFQQEYEERIDKQRNIIESHEGTIKQLREDYKAMEIKKITFQNQLKAKQTEMKDMEQEKNRELDEYRKVTQTEMTKLEIQLKEYNVYMGQRDAKEEKNKKLKKQLDEQSLNKVRDVADKQREKVQEIDRLRDEMLMRISDMRTNLLSLKKEQLSTTTRLAVLQNHQLASELEFQSKQSEKLMFQNETLLKKVSNLQKDLEIHKEIEDQLAKRSHYSRGIIKKLTAKITELEEQCKAVRQELQEKLQIATTSAERTGQHSEMVRTLDRQLDTVEKKCAKLQADLLQANTENASLKAKSSHQDRRTDSLTVLLGQYYDSILEGSLPVRDGSDNSYDLKTLRTKPVEQWSADENKLVVNTLLTKLAPNITRKNLASTLIKNEMSVIDSQDFPLVKLPRISEHSAVKLDNSMKGKLGSQVDPKVVGSNLRDWGRTVHSNSVTHLFKKYKVAEK